MKLALTSLSGVAHRYVACIVCVMQFGNRDLAQNWDVDIASSLEDYLEDLEEITITLDGGASKINFAEASLLIQVISKDNSTMSCHMFCCLAGYR